MHTHNYFFLNLDDGHGDAHLFHGDIMITEKKDEMYHKHVGDDDNDDKSKAVRRKVIEENEWNTKLKDEISGAEVNDIINSEEARWKLPVYYDDTRLCMYIFILLQSRTGAR